MRAPLAGLLCLLLPVQAQAQTPATSPCRPTLAPRGGGQFADTAFDQPVLRPAFPTERGPVILLDEAHANFHTVDGRYAAFARLLRRDGFVVRGLRDPASSAALAEARILVIANAIAAVNRNQWTLPIRSAFEPAEIEIIRRWVAGGGSLLLIADHMPFPAAVEALARAFGVFLINGFATDSTCAADELMFRRAAGTLGDHPITRGRHRAERIDSVRSFTGEAFQLLSAGRPLLRLESGAVVLLPVTAWEFSDSTPRLPAEGLLHGAALSYGRGRVAVFGEAAMFTAQLSGRPLRPMGMNAASAGQNPQFLLNVIHWLAGLLPAG